MSANSELQSETVVDAVSAGLRACNTAPDGMVRPAAILWPDPERQWQALQELLLEQLPEMVVLGNYEPQARKGPAIWIRCVLERTLEEPVLPEAQPPIIYMPGVSRQELRAGEDCPPPLKPLIELLYRGSVWLQRNGNEWTVTAFLTSREGVGLDVARDRETKEALMRALREVAGTPLSQLQGRRLEAEDFDRLLSADVVRDLLLWMGNPAATKKRMGLEHWAAFCSQSHSRFELDPETDSELTAAERLGYGEKPWEEVWTRFTEAPKGYPGVPDVLRRVNLSSLPFDRSRWPHINDDEESAARKALNDVAHMAQREACERVTQLERENAERRDWVWAALDMAPIAEVLKPLGRLARGAQSALGGSTPDEIAEAYVAGAWETDAAAWEAVALAGPAEERLVKDVVRTLQGTWLDDSARAFQHAAQKTLPENEELPAAQAEAGSCLVFADGLRYETGRRLAERLERRGCRVDVRRRWAALPTVTATAKPAVTPAASEVSGAELPEDFAPQFTDSGKKVEASSLREALRAGGFQVLGDELVDVPVADDARGWLETGVLDRRGHDLQEDLAKHIGKELDGLAERIVSLLNAGWRSIRVVTDHGWLLLPGGLPKIELPKHLTASRWSRCAVVAGQSEVEAPVFPWHWNGTQYFATAPGAGAFTASQSYAHGGVSIQECLIPELTVERGGEPTVKASIRAITWRGMRCFIEASPGDGEVTADLRAGGAKGQSVAASPKTLDKEGTTSLVVPDDAYEDAELTLVLLDAEGTVLAQKKTRVGVTS